MHIIRIWVVSIYLRRSTCNIFVCRHACSCVCIINVCKHVNLWVYSMYVHFEYNVCACVCDVLQC